MGDVTPISVAYPDVYVASPLRNELGLKVITHKIMFNEDGDVIIAVFIEGKKQIFAVKPTPQIEVLWAKLEKLFLKRGDLSKFITEDSLYQLIFRRGIKGGIKPSFEIDIDGWNSTSYTKVSFGFIDRIMADDQAPPPEQTNASRISADEESVIAAIEAQCAFLFQRSMIEMNLYQKMTPLEIENLAALPSAKQVELLEYNHYSDG